MSPRNREDLVEIVVKVGGGVLVASPYFDAALVTIDAAARGRRLLVVPGGGPFADAVREVDRRFGLSNDAAHWMAVLAMDQYAHLLAARLTTGVLVRQQSEIAAAFDRGRVPVLAPSRWLQDVDPLPHTWDVTSDSIAAWVAREVGASRLVLVKPAGASHRQDVVDPYFSRALASDITPMIVTADDMDALRDALRPLA